jgi:2,3-dihydroxybenzoate-AMP ligase
VSQPQHSSATPSGLTPWPDDLAAAYRAAGHWRGETLGALLRTWAQRDPSRTALVYPGGRMTYGQLDERADRQAAGLVDLGIAAGDRVVVQLPNVAEFVVLLFALCRAGAIPLLTLPAHRETEIAHLAELSGAVAYVIADRSGGFDYRELAAAVRLRTPSLRHVLVVGDPGPFQSLAAVDADPRPLAEPDPADVAVLLVSGGTTGTPKLIPRTHDDYAYNARESAAVCGLDEDSVYLVALPIAHNFPLACPGVLGTLGAGGTVVLARTPSPDEAFALVEREGVTLTALVPALAQLWIEAVEWGLGDVSSLRLLQVGGAKLAPEHARQVRPALGCECQQVFGMAEGLLNYTRAEDDDGLVATTQGRPLSPDDEIRVVDENGIQVERGEVGELLTRGPYTLRGYYRAPEHNATTFTDDGFYCSGDLVRQLESGHLVVIGRVKDTINRGGESISAEEIEDHVVAHPGVRGAAVIGLPDDDLGERICAVVVADGEPPTLAELKGFLRERGIAAFKLPDQVETIGALPLTGVGKVSKRDLVELLAGAPR